MGWGDPVSSHKRELILPFGVFAGEEAVCISSTPTPAVGLCPCALLLCVAQPCSDCRAHWGGALGLLSGVHTPSKPPGKAQEHLVTQSLRDWQDLYQALLLVQGKALTCCSG